ncbi:MAG: ABC transporter substrate-binding protein [Bacteriovorax sp.]|nr:ABC transporter substrate-binding protein [Bacteriovorax sp.]
MRSFLILLILILTPALWADDCEKQDVQNAYIPRFAKLFTIKYYQDFKIVESGPDHFIVADRLPLKCETALPVFTAHAKRFIATSTTHLPFLKQFNLEETLVGFPGVRYIFNPKLKSKKIKDINYQLNPEELLSLKPDLVMAYSANLTSEKRMTDLRKLKIPLILNRDFEETHPLARAEWMVFSAVFFSKDLEAKKMFKSIEDSYLQTAGVSRTKNSRPKILVGDIQNGKWATCGGLSDLAILIKDAGAELLLKSDSTETQFISLEKILSLKERPAYWLSQNTWKDLSAARKDSRYKKFLSVPVYNNNNQLNAEGFNDYWETGISRPDLLLKDVFDIFNNLPSSQLKLNWYKELK